MSTEYVTWPMEANVSPAALHHVAEAIEAYCSGLAPSTDGALRAELENTANDIRSLLQHVVVARQAAVADDWLDA